MFDKLIANIKNGFRVANATRKLVFSDKELFAYPIIAALISIVIAALVLGLIVAGYLAGTLARLTNAELALIVIVALVVLYFLAFYVTSFFTVAMLLAFREHAKGKRLSMGDALRRTVPYSKLILEWSAFYTTVITIINIIEGAIRAMLSRYGVVGNVISGLMTGGINLALAAAVAFSLPVIIDEKKGPVATIKSSISFIMRNFGDTFGGLLFAEIFQIVLMLVGLGLIVLGILPFFVGSGSAPVGGIVALSVILIALGAIVIIAGVLLRYVLFNCFKLIVYDYKTRGTLPKGFNAKLIESGVKRKNSQKGGKFGINAFGIGTGQGEL
jgi:membrane-anchored glycerophosphoryl diester phosphodiesterase (GDPDase)